MKPNKFDKFNSPRALPSMAVFLLFIFFATVIVALYFEFNAKLSHRFNQNTLITLSEASSQIVDTITLKSNAIFKTLESISLSLSDEADLFSKDLYPMLEKQKQLNGFTSIGVVDRSGTVYYSDGKTADVSDAKYFKSALLGNSAVSKLAFSPITNKHTLTYAVPLLKKDRIEGVLICTFQNNHLADLIDLQMFGSRGMLYIMQADGQILTRNNFLMPQGNFFDILALSKIDSEFSAEQMKDGIKNRQKGLIKYTPIHKEAYYAYYEPLDLNDWYLVSVVPESFISTQSALISKLSLNMVVKSLGLLVLLFTIVVYLLYHTFRKVAVVNRKFEALVSNVPGGMFCFSTDGDNEFDYISDGLLKIFGCTEDEFRKRFDNRFINSIYYKDRERVASTLRKDNPASPIKQAEYRIECTNGEIRWLLGRGQSIYDDLGECLCYVVVMDITQVKETLENLRLNEERYRIVVAQTESMIYEYNALNGTLFHNSLLFRLKFGYPLVQDGFPDNFTQNIHPEDAEIFLELYKNCTVKTPTQSAEIRLKKADGCFVWCSVQNTTIFSEDGTPLRYIGGILDVDKRRRETESLKQLAQLDPLTALYNKTSIQSRIEACLAENDGKHALMFIDVDNFKAINDNLGHLFGDAILSELAAKLQVLAGDQSLAGRVGGDEFVLFLKNCYEFDELCQRAEEVCSIFSTYSKENSHFPISCSIGIAVFPQDGTTYEELTHKADSALYDAKEQGKNCFEFYSDGTKLIKRENTTNFPIFSPNQDYIDHHFSSFIFDILYQSQDIVSDINFVLSLIGQHYRLSRTYIDEMFSARSASFISYEWCTQGTCSISDNKKYNHAEFFDAIKGKLNSDGVFLCCDSEMLSDVPPVASHFISQKLSSLLYCAILDNGAVCGFVCFEQLTDYEPWSTHEVHSLALCGKIVGSFLMKMRNRQIFQQQYSAVQSVIDCQNTWLYVIEAETNRLLYVSRRTARDFAQASVGAVCYESLDDSMPCAHCLANRITLDNRTVHERYFSKKTNQWMLYSAARFFWPLGNKSAILITYRTDDSMQR